jgi:hypothetical protein
VDETTKRKFGKPILMRRTLLDVFNDDFARELNQARNYPDAYEKATEKFEQQHGFTAFDSYDSFRKKKERKSKRR